ncbi:hypothetical protein EDD85DRAFT_939646 [Armillaria nabsnona]|nr:hypothetical protein EDD85DRAFT_939646 [Armillaria nabsnona]
MDLVLLSLLVLCQVTAFRAIYETLEGLPTLDLDFIIIGGRNVVAYGLTEDPGILCSGSRRGRTVNQMKAAFSSSSKIHQTSPTVLQKMLKTEREAIIPQMLDEMLMRFLRTRKFNLIHAKQMFSRLPT